MNLNDLRKMDWHATWIWGPAFGDPRYSVRYFRRTFRLDDPRRAKLLLHLSADSRYRLYVNGEPVGRGPARGDLDHYTFETYDLSDRLRRGVNVLAVQVVAYGLFGPLAEVHAPHGGLLAQGVVRTADGRETPLDSDESWRVLADEAYTARYCRPPGTFWINPFEQVDGSALPWGWEQPDYDDGSWSAATVINQAAGAEQAGHPRNRWRLVPRAIAPLAEYRVGVEAVVEGPRADEMRRLLGPGSDATLAIPAHSEAEWTLYTGKLFTGYPALTVDGGAGARVELSYAEALTRDGVKGRRDDLAFGQVDPASPSDVYLVAGRDGETWQPLWWRCARFIRLRVTTAGEPLTLRGIELTMTHYPFERRGSFESSDPQLREIWDVAWHTALCCAHEHYEDCPFYEQLQYTSDTRLQILISYNAAGDDSLARAAIRAFDRSRLAEGPSQSRYPNSIQQIIPSFCLLHVLMVEDHYRYFGDTDFLAEIMPGIGAILGWFERYVDESHLVGVLPGWAFVDWCEEFPPDGTPPESATGPIAVHNLMLVAALDSAAWLYAALGDDHQAARCSRRAEALRAAIRESMWNESEGLYADGPGSRNLSRHANIWAIVSDTATPGQTARIAERLLDDPRLTRTTLHYDYYLFQALVKVGLWDRLDEVLAPWRKMLSMGFSTFPETGEPTRSECHAWSSWPMVEFQRVLLGVRPAEPGYASATIAPHPFGGVTEARGRVTTCRGDIDVAWRSDGGRFALKARLPRGMAATIELPTGQSHALKAGGDVTVGDTKLAATLSLEAAGAAD